LDKKGVRDIQQDINVLLEENKYRWTNKFRAEIQ
jgi:hypothetical protein